MITFSSLVAFLIGLICALLMIMVSLYDSGPDAHA